jgi:signal transduction histidine kinase
MHHSNNLTVGQAARAQFLVSASAVGIVAVDEQGIIRSCNPAAEKLLNRPANDLVGHPLGFPTTVDDTREIDVMLPDASIRTVQMRVSTTTWEGQQLYITALHDPGMPHAPDWEQHSMAISIIAHELDNPLAAIRIATNRLRHDTTDRTDLLDAIDNRLTHMHTLIDKLRTAARIDFQQTRLPTEPVRVFDLLMTRLHTLAENAHDVDLSCDPDITVLANPTELAQMLDNYLSNALTHGHSPVHIQVVEHDPWVTVKVHDQGPGVPEEFQPRLFERFQTDCHNNHTAGTGLGLWITRNLARAHGGDAWYEPARPHGACFCIRLPAPQPPLIL